jgi:hypothetical protein
MNSKFDKNEKNAPEKQTDIKGTVIASGDAESLAAKKRLLQSLQVVSSRRD